MMHQRIIQFRMGRPYFAYQRSKFSMTGHLARRSKVIKCEHVPGLLVRASLYCLATEWGLKFNGQSQCCQQLLKRNPEIF